MKRILLTVCMSIATCFCTQPVQAGAVWLGTSGDNLWNTVGNWNNDPAGATCIFRDAAQSPPGTIYFNADINAGRIRQQATAAEREVTIFSNNVADVTFTLFGAAETWDGGGAASNWVFNGSPNGNGARLKMNIESFQQWSVGTTNTSVILNLDVSGVGGFVKTAPGTLELNGTNTFWGTNNCGEGTVKLGNPKGLGYGGGGTTVSAGGTLDLNGQSDINEILTLNGNGTAGEGALINSSSNAASLADGLLSSATVTSGGSGYSAPTAVTLSGGGGSGATATALLGLTTASITIDNGGLGYDAAPYVIITGGGPADYYSYANAGATSQIDQNGTVTNVTVTFPGNGYTSAPTVTFLPAGFVDGGGTAHADANHFTITGVLLTDAGSGYTNAPTISFSGGTGAAATASFTSVTLGSDSSVGGTGDITIEPNVSGAFGLTKVGANTVTLAAANTYSGSTTVGEGTLALGAGGSIASSPVIDVQNGATFDVSAVTGGFVLGASQTLMGNGTVLGNVTADGTIAPGASVGSLAITGDLTIAGDLVIEVDKSLSPSNDMVAVSGTLTNAGSGPLMVANIGGTALATGDSFQIFNQPVLNGDAINVVSGGSEVWTNMLAVDGSIAVLSAPAPVPATNVTIQATGPSSYSLSGLGAADSFYAIYASTNVALPMTNWWLIGSTFSDGGGLIQFVDSQATNDQRFYRFGQ